MKFYYRSSINEEDTFTIWKNGLKERLHLTESLFLKNFSAGTVYLKLSSLCFFVSVFNYSLLPNNDCILSSKFKCALLLLLLLLLLIHHCSVQGMWWRSNNIGICNESTLPLLAIKLTGLVFEKSGRKLFPT